MRTVSFSDNNVRTTIANRFVATHTNIRGDHTAGQSFSHSPNDAPGPCGRGAGRQNVQLLFMTPNSEIFHVATGFMSAEDLREEMSFALDVFDSLDGGSDRQRSKIASANAMPKQQLVALQNNRLRGLGFSSREIQYDNPMQSIATGFSPSDLGIKMPIQSAMFGDVARQRTLRDTKFVLRNPLIFRASFESDPAMLVGRGGSFFGSNAAMDQIANMTQ